ncbi:MAG: ABC transporter ATP-binding protein [Alphaproteobacteria bacterium]
MLELDEVISGYGRGTVLDRVSLRVGEGDILGLLGRNGAGKTTLLKTVMGLIRARSGRVRLEGADITRAASFEIARNGIAYVPQGRQIFDDFTVEQNLRMGDLGGGRFERAYGPFPGLAQWRRKRAGDLSGGQQQQLAIGRALMGAPRLLLLDEPSEGLQPSMVAEITGALGAIARESGAAILLVEQNIDMVLGLCGRCAFLEGGRIAVHHEIGALEAAPEILEEFLAF